jgi:hypothetical protein
MSEIPPETPDPPRRSIYDAGPAPQPQPVIEEIEETPPIIDDEFLARIAADREAKSARAASEFQRLDTKVSIGDIGKENFKRPEREPGKVPTIKLGTREEIVRKRTAEWTNWIIEDANPLLLKATQTWCSIPDPWIDGKVFEAIEPTTNKHIIFWEPSLRTRLELSEKKAKTLAKAAAEFSVSPFGVAIVTWIETHQLLITVGAAMWVAAQYGWVLMQTKAEVAQVKQIAEQQAMAQLQNQAMAENPYAAGANGNVRYPAFGETTTAYDAESNS